MTSNLVRAPKRPFVTVGTSKADYVVNGTNDEVQIQAAIDESDSVFLKAGTYNIQTSSINVSDGKVIQGAGFATRINLANGRSVNVDTQEDVVIRDVYIDGALHSADQRAVNISNASDVLVEHCWVLNCEGFGIFVTGSTNETGKVRVNKCRLTGKGNNDVIGGGPIDAAGVVSEIIITDNYIQQDVTDGTYRIALDIVSQDKTIIANNILEGSLVLGGEKIPHLYVNVANNLVRPAVSETWCQIAVLTNSNASETDDSHSINIIGNQVKDGHIFVQGQSSTSSRTRKVNIHSNIINGLNDNPFTEANWALDLNYLADISIQGNIVDGSDRALYINTSIDVDASNNRFINCNNGLVLNGTTSGISGRNNVGIDPEILFAQGNITGATTFDRENGDTITGTLTGNITVTLISGAFTGDTLTLELTQDATGSRTVTWPSNFKKAGGTLTLSTSANAVDVIKMVWDSVSWVEVSRSLNVS